MEFVLGLVVIVHFGQHGNAAIPAAAVIVLGKFIDKLPDNARNNQRMFGGQEAAIAARRVRG